MISLMNYNWYRNVKSLGEKSKRTLHGEEEGLNREEWWEDQGQAGTYAEE